MNNSRQSVVNNVAAVSVRRTISAFKPGQPRQDFTSNAVTWGELKREIISKGFSLDNTRVFEGNTQIDLVSEDAILPTNIEKRGTITNDLIIMMTPQTKIKSGAINVETASYRELKAEVKEIFNSNRKDDARVHFGNYTQLPTASMRTLLASWLSTKSTVKKDNKASKATSNTSISKENKKTKLDSVRENLEKKNYTQTTPEVLSTFNVIAYNEALSYMLFGMKQLQNEVYDQVSHDLPTDVELEMLSKKIK